MHLRLMLVLLVGVLAGCTHPLRVLNADQFRHVAMAPQSLRVLIEVKGSTEDAPLVFAARDALSVHSSVERVAVAGEAPSDFEPTATVSILPTTNYVGSGWNYPITFPGFLVFAHAWNGFLYEASVETEIELLGAGGGVTRRTLQTDYQMRFCDTDRGILTSSGWYSPGWGALNIVFGFFNVGYDEDATPLFLKEVREGYGEFIAAHIVELARDGPSAPTHPSAHCVSWDPVERRFTGECTTSLEIAGE